MPASRPSRRAALLAALLVGSLCAVGAPQAAAQTPTEGSVALELIGQPVWHGSDDPLGLRLRVTNEGLSTLAGFNLLVRAYTHATSRSDLHQNFEVDPLRLEASSLLVERDELDVPAGTSTDVLIEAPVSGLASLVGGDAGVYPLRVILTDVDGSTTLDSVTTQLLYFPEEVEVPLNVVLVWPLVDIPARQAGGIFVASDEPDEPGLEAAIAAEGWLTGVLDALSSDTSKGLRMGLSPGPRLIEELADMADGYRRDEGGTTETVPSGGDTAQAAAGVGDRLEVLFEEERFQPIHVPYAFSDLTSIDDFEQLSAQLNAARSVLEERLGFAQGQAWLFPPAGRLDDITLERLRSSEAAASTFFAADALTPEIFGTTPGCRQDFVGISYTCPVKVTTATGRSRGFVLDAELQQRFGSLVAAPGNVGELQKLFAEIAMIWAELPGTADRVLAVAVPPLWHPPPAISRRFVRTMASAPWLRTRTPRGGLHLGIGTIERELVADASRSRVQPDESYFEAIDEAAAVVESFARIKPPVSLVQRLRRDVLVGHSLLWWSNDEGRLETGASFAAEARAEAEDALGQISIAGRPNITLASRRGTLPLSLQNSADYPVTVEIHLESSDRDLELSDRTVEQTFEPGATPLSVQISARASGRYPVRVRVLTSDGYEISQTSISINSTEFNEIALAITVGALLFLVTFSTVRGVRRRKKQRAEEATDGKADG